MAREGQKSSSDLARTFDLSLRKVRDILESVPSTQAIVDKIDSERAQARVKKLAPRLITLYAALFVSIASLVLAFLSVNQNARAANTRPAIGTSIEPLNPSSLDGAFISSVRVEVHQENSWLTYLGATRPQRSLWVYFKVLLPAGSTTPVDELRWNITVPQGATMIRGWHDQNWDQEPNAPIGPIFDSTSIKQDGDKVTIMPFDFGVHTLQFDGGPRELRILQVGAEFRVGEQIVVGHDSQRGLAGETLGVRWNPPTGDWIHTQSYATSDLAGRQASSSRSVFKVELVACQDCFSFLDNDPAANTGAHGIADSGATQLHLVFAVENEPWAWIASGWFVSLVTGALGALGWALWRQVKSLLAVRFS